MKRENMPEMTYRHIYTKKMWSVTFMVKVTD